MLAKFEPPLLKFQPAPLFLSYNPASMYIVNNSGIQYGAAFFFSQDGDLVKSFFGVDCLHFSVQGHAAAALALWNNMVGWLL